MKRIITAIALSILASVSAFAEGFVHATLTWSPNPEADIAHYRIYAGNASREYSAVLSTETPTNVFHLKNLPADQTWFIAVTAVNTAGLESGYSNEVVLGPDTPTDVPPSIPNGPALREIMRTTNEITTTTTTKSKTSIFVDAEWANLMESEILRALPRRARDVKAVNAAFAPRSAAYDAAVDAGLTPQ